MILTPATAVVAFLAMVLGECWRVGAPGARRDAPIAQATGIALAMSASWPAADGAGGGRGWVLGLLAPLVLAVAAVVVGRLVRPPGGQPSRELLRDLARCLATVLVAGLLARVPGPGGVTLIDSVERPGDGAGLVAVLLLTVASVAVAVPLVGRAAVGEGAGESTFAPRLLADLQRSGLLPLATATIAAVMAISLPVLGPAALLLGLVPMVVLLPAVTRQRSIRAAQRQTIVALAGLTDQAGLTSPGHALRVASLAVPVAREVGVEAEDLPDVETVALLHDVGQVGLARPIPGGATAEISTRDQRRVATTGAAILARTAQLSRVAPMVADVGVPHHRAVERGDVSWAARVVRVVSTYDDLTGQGARLARGAGPGHALERMVRATPHEFDPDVMGALLRQLERRGDLSPAAVGRLREALSAATSEASGEPVLGAPAGAGA